VGNSLEINKIAGVGDEISFKTGVKGIVKKIYQNSVMVAVTENTTELNFEGNKTIIGHKNYEII
jgi:uncharacterized protein YkvS